MHLKCNFPYLLGGKGDTPHPFGEWVNFIRGNRQAFMWRPTGYHMATDRLSCGGRQAIIWRPTGCHVAADRLSYGGRQAVMWRPTGYHKATATELKQLFFRIITIKVCFAPPLFCPLAVTFKNLLPMGRICGWDFFLHTKLVFGSWAFERKILSMKPCGRRDFLYFCTLKRIN